MAVVSRGYTAGKFMLEIAGTEMGFLTTVEGGDAVGSVVGEAPDGGVIRKHIGNVSYEPLRFEFASGMAAQLYGYIGSWLQGKAPTLDGAVIFLDYNFVERTRIEFRNASIIAVDFPESDGASKAAVHFAMTLQPESTRVVKASAGTHKGSFGSKSPKSPIASNFRLKVGELKSTRVNRVDALVVRQPILAEEDLRVPVLQPLQIPDLCFTLPEVDAQDFFDWFDAFVIQGNSGQDHELGGALEWLAPDLKQVLFTLQFVNLGIYSIRREASQTGVEVVARVRVSLYCEQMRFTSAPESAGAPIAAAAPAAAPAAAGGAALVNALAGILGARVHDTATLAAVLAAAAAQGAHALPDAPARIAERLQATVRPPDPPEPTLPRRDEGLALGVRWATETATLDELEQLVALEPRDWSAVRLPPSHTLVGTLVGASALPASATDAPLALERDPFVEGLVAGASQVLRSAAPHLTRPDAPGR